MGCWGRVVNARTPQILAALNLPGSEPTPGDTIMTRLIEAEAKLRAMGCNAVADTAAQFQRDIARMRAPFLYERWTADIEAFVAGREREAEMLRVAGLGEGEIERIAGEMA